MPTATPRWFDENYFIQQKVEQLNLIKWQDKSDWDADAYRQTLASSNTTPYEAFVASNDATSLEFTNISPNPLFNVQEYLVALANFANASGYSYAGYPAGQWTAQKAMEHMFNDYHVSAWDHFTLAGQFDLVNPSNAFDIKTYYQELTVARNNYIDPQTGIRGWEGRTDWTMQEVVNDNIWAEINPVEGLYGEGGTAGIIPVSVPLAEQVTINDNWNPWVTIPSAPTTPDTPTTPDAPSTPTNPGGSSSGGSTNPPSVPDDSAETINVNGADKPAQTLTGKYNQNTIFNASDGLNPDSVLNGGSNSSNTLNVNMQTSFPGFNGVSTDSGTDPNVTNIQNVVLTNDSAAPLDFNAKNMSGVDNWTIKDGVINLNELSSVPGTVRIDNVHGESLAIGFAENATGNAVLDLVCSKVASSGNPLAIKMANVETLNVIDDGSYCFLNLSDVSDASRVTASGGSANIGITGLGPKVESFDASNATAAVNLALEVNEQLASIIGAQKNDQLGTHISAQKLSSTVSIDGGAGAFDSLMLSGSGDYSGKWSNLEWLSIAGGANDPTVINIDASDITGLNSLEINRDIPDAKSDIDIENLVSGQFTIYEHTSSEGQSSVAVNGDIDHLSFMAEAASNTARNGEDASQGFVKTAFASNGQVVSINIAKGTSLLGTIDLPGAERVNVEGKGGLGAPGDEDMLTLAAANADEIDINTGACANLDVSAKGEINLIIGHSEENVKIRATSEAAFKSAPIFASSIDLDLSGVAGTIGNNDSSNPTLQLIAQKDCAIQSGNGGSNVAVTAKTASISGGSGDDTYFAFVSQKAEMTGNGGNDAFFAYAQGYSGPSGGFIETIFNGDKGAGHERFVINTNKADSKLALTINGYDSHDTIEIMNQGPMQEGSAVSPGSLVLQVMDVAGAAKGQPLLDNVYDRIMFNWDGERITLDLSGMEGVNGPEATYETLLAAVQQALAENPACFGLTASLGPQFSYSSKYDPQLSYEGTSIVISADEGTLSPGGWQPTGQVPADSDIYLTMIASGPALDNEAEATLTVNLINITGALEGQPLHNVYDGFSFEHNGVRIDVDLSMANSPDATYQDLLTAFQNALAANPSAANVTASLGRNFTAADAVTAQEVQGQSIVLTCTSGTLSVPDNCWSASSGISPDAQIMADVSYNAGPAPETTGSFAEITESDALPLLAMFGIDSVESMTAIGTNDGAAYGYLDQSGNAYGFVEDNNGELFACVQVTGIDSVDAAMEAFGIA